MPPIEKPLRSLQRNWLYFLQANPGTHHIELTKRELVVVESLQRRGLIEISTSPVKSPRGRTVYALTVNSEADRREAEQ